MDPLTTRTNSKPHLFFFGLPSFFGRTDTKLTHLIVLLHENCEITVIPNDAGHLENKTWTAFLDKHGAKYCLLERLPKKVEGFALALSNECFFVHGIAQKAKDRGLKIVWSS